MNDLDIDEYLTVITNQIKAFEITAIDKISKESRSPFKVLIGTIISARTKDEVTYHATERLFGVANTPAKILELSKNTIQDLIYPAGFYKSKAGYILDACQSLVDNFNGTIPHTIDELVTLKGVGRKTANLVLTLGFNSPGICVDTHVHRITNRWGYVNTKNPKKTEFALRGKLPKKWWIPINNLLVAFGQNTCKPISPLCSQCPLDPTCQKIGVTKYR